MSTLSVRKNEKRDVWVVITIALVFAFFVMTNFFHSSIVKFFDALGSELPFVVVINNLLAFWLASLLWVAYRRWRHVSFREKEMADIFFSINPVILLVVDNNGKIVTCNPAVNEVLHFEPNALLGCSVNVLIPGLYAHNKDLSEPRPMESQRGYRVTEMEGFKRTGEPISLEVITCELLGSQGTVSLIKDITERVRSKRALLFAKQQMEEANEVTGQLLTESEQNFKQLQELEEQRDSLVHMIVHDMKSPLMVIMSFLQMMQSNDSTSGLPSSAEFDPLELTKTSSERLLNMITSLLDVSRFESGDMSLHLASSNLNDMVETSFKSLAPLLKKRRVELDVPDRPVTLSCDPEILQRVIYNLLDNAIKYTSEGDSIDATLTKSSTYVRFSIKDSGPGVAPEDHEHIFEKFARVKTETTTKSHPLLSSGLGLAFCKLAVDAHQGRIGIESEPGKGSTFWFTLPLI